jgi:virginiamycin A acetyltransferase
MASIKEKIKGFFIKQLDILRRKINHFRENQIKAKLGYCAPDVVFRFPVFYSTEKVLDSIFLYESTWIYEQSKFIMDGGKFIMRKNSGAAQGLTVITVNHPSEIGMLFKDIVKNRIGQDKDVIVEEDVWIGANVTLLAGVKIGRGAVIGAGSVCRTKIPPYAIAIGNPAKVVGFRFRPDGILEHENSLYPESERLPEDLLQKNYNKYFESQYE